MQNIHDEQNIKILSKKKDWHLVPNILSLFKHLIPPWSSVSIWKWTNLKLGSLSFKKTLKHLYCIKLKKKEIARKCKTYTYLGTKPKGEQ